ncbi:ABC transporter ATP-binding protein [Candidatus Saccharibacteria bacterium]|nr:ABC transporter ATP-binding protein [Candidatus Saccharibacteria bacterium]
MATVIDLKEVSRIYGFGNATTVALEDISLGIEKGEFVAIMGPSGSGKSSLLHIIGLLDRPTHGTYTLGSRLVSKLRPNRLAKARRDHIGFVFQSFNLLPRLTAIENVALPLAYKGMTQTKRLKQASSALERVGLSDREYFYPKALSGGQAQRVAIARALVNSPSLIIADEPTGNLDSLSSRIVMEILAELHATGSTILMVTHNPELTRYATRVLYMHDGCIIYDEKTKLGEVPARARSGGEERPSSDEDEQLAGVSAFINAIPAKAAPPRKVLQPKTKKRKRAVRKTAKSPKRKLRT